MIESERNTLSAAIFAFVLHIYLKKKDEKGKRNWIFFSEVPRHASALFVESIREVRIFYSKKKKKEKEKKKKGIKKRKGKNASDWSVTELGWPLANILFLEPLKAPPTHPPTHLPPTTHPTPPPPPPALTVDK